MSRLRIFPPVATVYPNDRKLFTADAVPPPAMWHGVTNSGDIKSDFTLEVDGAGSQVTGSGAHSLRSGIGIIEFTIDDQCRPTSSGRFNINAFITDIDGFTYFYGLNIDATAIEVRDELNNQIYTESYTTLSGDVYRIELLSGFRLYRNGVLKHSRVGLATVVVYPMTYQCTIIEPTATAPTRIPQPRLIGDWRLKPALTWTTPSHGSLTVASQSLTTEYFSGVTPGTYTLFGAVEPSADAGNVQRGQATIIVPPLQVLGPTALSLLPGQKVRFKTNYDAAQNLLIAWSVAVGAGSVSQGEYTAPTAPESALVRAFADVNDQVADITVTVPAVITNPNGYTAAKASEQIDFDTNISLLPKFVSNGTTVSGTGDVTPLLPPLLQKDDIMLLFVETANQVVSTPSGWAIVTDSPQGTGTAGDAAATRLSIFWKRAVAVETAPTITDPGDHAIARISAFRFCIASGNPWDVTAGDTAASDTSVSIPGDTTTVVNCLVVQAVSHGTDTLTPQVSGFTNAGLANIQELIDVATDQGNGGGFAMITGQKADIGSFGATTATLANASTQGRITIALKPGVAAWTASIGSINGTSGLWTAPSQTGQTARITVTNGTLTVTQEIDVLEAFPRTDFKLPWPIDLIKRVLVSEAEDGSRTSRVKGRARRSFPVELLVDAVEDLNGAGLDTIQAFWDRHHPGVKFILEDPEEGVRLVVYSDSDLRWEHTGAGINIAFRVKEA